MTRLLALCLFLLSGLPALALCNGPGLDVWLTPGERAALTIRTQATRFGEGLLWSARRDGGQMIILGTMHLPDQRHGPLLDRVAPYLQAADIVLVEATQNDQRDMQAHIANTPSLIMIQDGPSLIDRLDEDTWTAIAQAVEARGMPPFMAARMQPWFLTMTLSMPPCATAALLQGEKGLDNLLMDRVPPGTELRALEDWRDLLDLFSAGTFEDQMSGLKSGLVAPEIMDALVVSMLDAYFAGHTAEAWHINAQIARFVPDMDQATFNAEFDRLTQELLIDRNRAWLPVIEEAASTHDHVFIAFGAAHLVGDAGVLALLEAQGWDITRLD